MDRRKFDQTELRFMTNYFLGFGEHVEIISPEILRKDYLDCIKRSWLVMSEKRFRESEVMNRAKSLLTLSTILSEVLARDFSFCGLSLQLLFFQVAPEGGSADS